MGRRGVVNCGMDNLSHSLVGLAVGELVTDASGAYNFTNLPVLPAGSHYTVTVDPTASGAALAGFTD